MPGNGITLLMTGVADDFYDARWRLNLNQPPEIVSAGLSTHGLNGEERYLLANHWCLHLYLYEVELQFDQYRFQVRPGYVTIVPPNIPICYAYTGPGTHLYFLFTAAEADKGDGVSVPPISNLGDAFEGEFAAIKNVVGSIDSAPYRLRSRLWSLLAMLADRNVSAPNHPATAHPAVRRAQQLIELRLSDTISVADLADEVDVSLSYLAKLFRKACGQTVAEYIIRRRAERAFHLIANSTMPIKAIAYSVGLPDLQQFNKAIRRSFGRSPRTIREMATNGP